MNGLAYPTAGGGHLLGISAMLVVAVLCSFRGAAADSATVHSAPSPAGDRGADLHGEPDLVRAPQRLAWDKASAGRMGLSFNFGLLPAAAGLIPRLIDQNPCAHWRSPMDMIFQGRSTRVFQA
jgi:hypothetical protein